MAKLIAFINICALIPLVFGQCDIENAEKYLKRSVYEFSVELVSRIAEDTDNHFVASALSPWTLISTVSLGATGETLEEIKKVLRLHPHKCFNKKFFEIIKTITSVNNGAVLERSSTLFVDNRMPLKEVFKERVKNTQVANIEAVPFDNPANVAAIVNDYVSKATRGTIEDIVSPNDLERVYLILIDALYFKGSWKTKFQPEDTETSAFYDDKGNQIGDVSLMFGQQNVNVTIVRQLEAKVLELPYTNEKFSMLFVLPETDVTIAKVLQNLKQTSLRTIFSQFNEPQSVSVQIPKFKISSDMDNMKELLIDMGLKTMFDINSAKFSDLSDYSLYISNFIQKANIDVTEEGTEASAASEAAFSGRSLFVNEFTANKPFLFMIVDRHSEIALFTGVYSKPSLYQE